MIGYIKKTFFLERKHWKDIEYFDSKWKNRIKLMSEYIDEGSKILDLGCGKMWLKEFITEKESYIPVDYVFRGEETIVCDFNMYQYPVVIADTAFVSGCLEYVKDYKWFITEICKQHEKCILSYCTIEYFPENKMRKNLTWNNHLSKEDILMLFKENNFNLVNEKLTETNNQLFVFEKWKK